MKIRLYLDTHAGDTFQYASAMAQPGSKSPYSTRIAFDVEIPQRVLDAINGVDEALPMKASIAETEGPDES